MGLEKCKSLLLLLRRLQRRFKAIEEAPLDGEKAQKANFVFINRQTNKAYILPDDLLSEIRKLVDSDEMDEAVLSMLS